MPLEIATIKRNAARWSVAASAVLIVMKLAVWLVSGSVSVLAEAVHSVADLLGSGVAFFTVRFADTPPDSKHEYGHGKFENMSGVFISLMIIVAASIAVHQALDHLSIPHLLRHANPALLVMGLSALSNVFVSRNLLKVGKQTDSPALIADGRHLQTDVATSICVFFSLLIIKVTGCQWIDPVAALVVSCFVFWIGLRIARNSIITLSDAALPFEEEEALRQALDADPRVLGYHKLRTRKSGSHRHVDVHVLIDRLSQHAAGGAQYCRGFGGQASSRASIPASDDSYRAVRRRS